MKPEVCFSFTIFWVFLVALTSKSRSPSALCISAFGLVNFSVSLHFFFFFSSRRRHTRYWRDWSSDVCSSDLQSGQLLVVGTEHFDECTLRQSVINRSVDRVCALARGFHYGVAFLFDIERVVRSEERRVGKECRSRWSPYH